MAMPSKEFEEDKEDWLVTYADAITLLMAFFVMLLSFTKYDVPALEEAAAAFKVTIGKQDQATSPIQLLKLDVQDVVYNMQADQVVNIDKDSKGLVIDLASSAFYKPGSADIREEAAPVLEKISQTLMAPRYLPYHIDVEGHTDDDPIATEKFPSNWELSAGRATRVVRFFLDQGVDAVRMKATGFAETQPKAPNRDVEGTPIKENQSKNRRVTVRVYPMGLEQREEFLRMVELRNQRQQSAAGAQLPPAADQPAGAAVAPIPSTAQPAAPSAPARGAPGEPPRQ
jgi:chemotaxis protein MotB